MEQVGLCDCHLENKTLLYIYYSRHIGLGKCHFPQVAHLFLSSPLARFMHKHFVTTSFPLMILQRSHRICSWGRAASRSTGAPHWPWWRCDLPAGRPRPWSVWWAGWYVPVSRPAEGPGWPVGLRGPSLRWARPTSPPTGKQWDCFVRIWVANANRKPFLILLIQPALPC